jgi:glutaredoxin
VRLRRRTPVGLVTFVTRTGCTTCAEALPVVERLAARAGVRLEVLDVDADPARKAEYSDRVPVILVDGKEHGYWRVEEQRLRAALAR